MDCIQSMQTDWLSVSVRACSPVVALRGGIYFFFFTHVLYWVRDTSSKSRSRGEGDRRPGVRTKRHSVNLIAADLARTVSAHCPVSKLKSLTGLSFRSRESGTSDLDSDRVRICSDDGNRLTPSHQQTQQLGIWYDTRFQDQEFHVSGSSST
ncbi:uncharacterized protein BO72DRAFT_280815 [Aspergillus fijiensis CBS 313.89]|uniref:Uncharacterized protein n=1 Tax=Aspergillus fijiensis CBS 313.89 TaxID=1448319 RepID=A0A8G1RWJ6_9EURO|nr:uncharacterized protein BO72DRAFT_280815 [Aspergillus fijiensis CBS 313.89]RAK80484.1 hypothetical protein BO72DRAFT_280815 [Aspergillus fijiensis CBS 313.89]